MPTKYSLECMKHASLLQDGFKSLFNLVLLYWHDLLKAREQSHMTTDTNTCPPVFVLSP